MCRGLQYIEPCWKMGYVTTGCSEWLFWPEFTVEGALMRARGSELELGGLKDGNLLQRTSLSAEQCGSLSAEQCGSCSLESHRSCIHCGAKSSWWRECDVLLKHCFLSYVWTIFCRLHPTWSSMTTRYFPSWRRYSSVDFSSFSRMMSLAALRGLFGNCLRNIRTSSRCYLDFEIPQALIESSFCSLCWNNNSCPCQFYIASCMF